MKSGKYLCRSLILLVLACPAGVLAAEDGMYHLGEVVVSGTDKGVEKIGTIHTVTAKEIEERGARTLTEAIKLVPGVQMRVGNDGTARVDMRGFRTRHVTLLLNGTPFNSTFDGQFDPSLISVENIAEIKVTTGGGSTLYGPGGNAGVINIITKKATRGAGGSLGTELGEAGTTLVRGTASYGSDMWDVFVSGSTYDQDRYLLSHDFKNTPDQPGNARRNSDRERKNLFANFGYAPSDVTQMGLTLSFMEGERGKPPVTNDGFDDYANSLKFEREDYVKNLSAQFALSHDFDGPLSFKGWTYLNTQEMRENGYDDFDYNSQDDRNSYRLNSKTYIAGVNTQLRYDVEKYGAATLGLMVENDKWRDDGWVVQRDGSRRKSRNNEDFQLYSASIEYEVQPVEDVDVVLGFGHHWQDRDDGSQRDYSYLMGVSYQWFEPTRLRASHYRKVRFPSLRDLYDPERGNLDLDAEVSRHYELGIEQQLPAKNLFTVTGYHATIEDYIERPEGEDQVRNYDKYQFNGIEFGLENTYIERLWIRASYEYLDSKDRSPDSNRDELQYRPKHRTAIEASYALPWWGLSAYTATWWVKESYYNARRNPDTNDQKRLENYVLTDCRINKKTSFNKGALDLYLGVNNLFDEDYEQSYGLPQQGQFFYGGANWTF
jgi:outer membrane cobalamin receptor